MIAHAAPSSHVRLKRLYERPSPQDGAGVLVDRLSWRSCAKQICHRSLKDIAPSKKPEAFDPGRGRAHEHTGPQRPLRLGSLRFTSGGAAIYGRSFGEPAIGILVHDRR